MEWIPLHVHSQYSILESTLSIKEYVKKAKEFEFSSLTLTDSGNLYGAVDFFKACKDKSIKPIIGCEVFLAPFSRLDKKKIVGKPSSYPLVLLAKDTEGYQNLCRLSSVGFLEGFYYRPRIDQEVLTKYSKGLICLSGPIKGKIASLILQGTEEELDQEIRWFQDLFKEDFYFEVQKLKASEESIQNEAVYHESWLYQYAKDFAKEEEKVFQKLLELSKKYSIPCVATNDVHYREKEDWQAHEILLNIQSGEPCEIWAKDSQGNFLKSRIPNPKRQVFPSHEFYFKSPDEMKELFKDFPEMLSRTQEIDAKCNLKMDFKTKYYPVYSTDHGPISQEEHQKKVGEILYKLCLDAIPERYREEELKQIQKKFPEENPLEMVKKRLDYEYELISSKGLSDYLLIVFDFISWAKKQNIPVGPGRGSVVGSILSYLLGITEIEPLRFSLFFERFINPERLAYPDIDVDICMERRGEVIDYIVQKYGQDRVAQIITFGTMKAKMAIKDVGRVLSIPLSKVNMIAKLVPEDILITLDKALKIDPELNRLYEEDDEAKKIIDLARKTEGSIRNTSTHAAGMIISASPLFDLLPLCHAKDSEMVVTQFAMKPVEMVGMLKIDFLGLKTLTSLKKCADFVRANHPENNRDWQRLPLEDQKTFELLNEGKTLGIFQLESSGMQDLLRKLHLDQFEEVIAVNALYRPGPMDMIPSYIQRKHGKEKIDFEHFLMEDILKETHGVMIYQEQVMQIASRLAGYTLAEGDVLRRAMGKKDKQEMEKQREKFLEGAAKNQISSTIATKIFEKIERFASYGFNKSHAAAYAYLSYATAYFKAHFPIEWMAALMNSDQDDLSKVAKFIQEAKSMGIQILPPDVNEGGNEFVPTKGGIRFAMSAIKGLGSSVVETIIQERRERGPFLSLFEFIKRNNTQKVSKKNAELLVQSGAFDFTLKTRDELFASIEKLYEKITKEQKEEKKGVMNLFHFDEIEENVSEKSTQKLPVNVLKMLQKEKELLGFYLSGHPLDSSQHLAQQFSCLAISDATKLSHESFFGMIFIIEELNFKIATKSQRKFALLKISDGKEIFEIPLWPEQYEKYGAILKENEIYLGLLQVEKTNEEVRFSCKQLFEISSLNEGKIEKIQEIFELEKKKSGTLPKKVFNKEFKKNGRQLVIRLDAEKTRFSKILKLKKLLRENPKGSQRVALEFYIGQKRIGKITTEAFWKAEEEEIIGKKIGNLDNVLQLFFES